MSHTNYLDELDGLLDNPTSESIMNIPAAQTHTPLAAVAATTLDTTNEAINTWAAVIENASLSLQEGARTVQDAAYKNLELAKNQSESIKELSDAASGWRHATRQAVQEVASTKKNIIILTVISGVIAVAGFGTTIGVMLQSRTGLASMSNAVLENVDEHQTLISRTLTLKMDEMAATIERMENEISQLGSTDARKGQAKSAIRGEAETAGASNSEIMPEEIAVTMPDNEKPTMVQETNNATPSSVVVQTTPPPAAITPTNNTAVTVVQLNEALITATAPLNQQMSEKLTQVTGQITQLEQNWKQSNDTVQKQLSLIPNAIDEKLTPRLQTLQKATANTTTPTTASGTTVISQDNKVVLEQLTRIRQDMAEIRQLQTALKEQVNRLNQSQNREPSPYQYRNPEVERYPR